MLVSGGSNYKISCERVITPKHTYAQSFEIILEEKCENFKGHIPALLFRDKDHVHRPQLLPPKITLFCTFT